MSDGQMFLTQWDTVLGLVSPAVGMFTIRVGPTSPVVDQGLQQLQVILVAGGPIHFSHPHEIGWIPRDSRHLGRLVLPLAAEEVCSLLGDLEEIILSRGTIMNTGGREQMAHVIRLMRAAFLETLLPLLLANVG